MTFRQSPYAALDQIIRQARHLLISFDGPIRSAIEGNPPAPHINDVLTACRESGRSAAVVTGTAAAEVRTYLDAHDLSTQITVVVPSIAQAASALEAAPAYCAFITSAPSDVEAAQRARIASIGYANKPGMQERMTQLLAGAVITSMADLALSLRAHSRPN